MRQLIVKIVEIFINHEPARKTLWGSYLYSRKTKYGAKIRRYSDWRSACD